MPEKKLGIGILGCGPISQFAHFESVQKSRNTVLEAVCDADEGLANRFGRFYDAKNIYLDYDQMLANPDVEAVIIGIADAFHVPAALKALAAGKHVLCEKPIGVAVEEVEELDAAVRKSGRILQIGHMLRFDPGIESARHFISTKMGEMLALKAWYCDSTHRYSMTDAVQPLARKGSKVLRPGGDPKADKQRYFMLAHGSHLVDLARYLGGPIRAVQARLNQRFGAHCWFIDVDFLQAARSATSISQSACAWTGTKVSRSTERMAAPRRRSITPGSTSRATSSSSMRTVLRRLECLEQTATSTADR